MAGRGGRFPIRAYPAMAAGLGAVVVAVILGTSILGPARPAPTSLVASATDQASSAVSQGPAASTPASPPGSTGPTPPIVVETPAPTDTPSAPTSIVPGSVDRSSLAVKATYDVHAAITVATGALDVTTELDVRNDSGEPIDRLELNTIAARLGGLKVTSATVDDAAVRASVRDQTIRVPLGGLLPDGASTTVRIAYRATLGKGLTGSSWLFTRAGDTLALYRWIPWISRDIPFDRPNDGDPFVTTSSPEVSVEILVDAPMALAAPAADVAKFQAGAGFAWSFTMHDVRDVSVVLAPFFHVAEEKVGDTVVRAYATTSNEAAHRLLSQGAQALGAEAVQLGVAYPWPTLVVVETEGGHALESPGLVWIPRTLDSLNRAYAVHHEIAHQWFYGLVGNDQRADPFADEAAADLLARTVLDSFRGSRCGRDALDKPINRYNGSCYYEVIYVQGGLLLDDVRKRMGSKAFWGALATYVELHRNGFGTTRQLLGTLRDASSTNLLPILRPRFPTLY